MDNHTKILILKKIEDRSEISDEDDCIIWNGAYKEGVCVLSYVLNGCKKVVNVNRFLWADHYPNIPIKSTEKLIRSCDNPKCVNIEHIKRLATSVSKPDVWERLLKKSKRNKNIEYGEIKCLEWSGYKDSGNYGKTNVKKKYYFVHRISYWIHHDEYESIEDIPKNSEEGKLEIAHKCNNPSCFEPRHLKLCSKIENSKDKVENGTSLRGSNNYFCTITEELAQKIKLSKTIPGDENHMTKKERAEQFRVSINIVNNIDNGRSWSYLPNINGVISPDISACTRKRRKDAKERIWTNKDFKKAQKKLESKAVVNDEGSFIEGSHCKIWNGHVNKNGYGQITVNYRTFLVHVLARCIKNKTLETNGFQVRHLCGKKTCINPSHLKFGTATENAADKVLHGTSGHKLDIKTANKIRSQYKTGKYIYPKLAKIYNVSSYTIGCIIRNEIYIDNSKKKYSGSKTDSKKNKLPTKIYSKSSKPTNGTESGSKTSKPKK